MTVGESVRRTGRCVVVHEVSRAAGFDDGFLDGAFEYPFDRRRHLVGRFVDNVGYASASWWLHGEQREYRRRERDVEHREQYDENRAGHAEDRTYQEREEGYLNAESEEVRDEQDYEADDRVDYERSQ